MNRKELVVDALWNARSGNIRECIEILDRLVQDKYYKVDGEEVSEEEFNQQFEDALQAERHEKEDDLENGYEVEADGFYFQIEENEEEW